MTFDLGEKQTQVFHELRKHCEEKLKMETIDYLELSMLADAFVNFFEAAEFCRKYGNTFDMPTKTGVYPMIRPEYNVKKTEYANILKHAAKFGLNPGDRERIFKSLIKEEPRPKGAERFMKKAQ